MSGFSALGYDPPSSKENDPLSNEPRTRSSESQRLLRRGGRVAEGNGLLNRHRAKSLVAGSNPALSATLMTQS